MLLDAIKAGSPLVLFEATPNDMTSYKSFQEKLTQHAGNGILFEQSTGYMIIPPSTSIGFELTADELSKYKKILLTLLNTSLPVENGLYAFNKQQTIVLHNEPKEYVMDIIRSALNFISISSGNDSVTEIRLCRVVLE